MLSPQPPSAPLSRSRTIGGTSEPSDTAMHRPVDAPRSSPRRRRPRPEPRWSPTPDATSGASENASPIAHEARAEQTKAAGDSRSRRGAVQHTRLALHRVRIHAHLWVGVWRVGRRSRVGVRRTLVRSQNPKLPVCGNPQTSRSPNTRKRRERARCSGVGSAVEHPRKTGDVQHPLRVARNIAHAKPTPCERASSATETSTRNPDESMKVNAARSRAIDAGLPLSARRMPASRSVALERSTSPFTATTQGSPARMLPTSHSK